MSAESAAARALIRSISHDLKGPLAAISGQTQLLQRRAARLGEPEGPEFAKRLARIEETTQRMAKLIDELVDRARQELHPGSAP